MFDVREYLETGQIEALGGGLEGEAVRVNHVGRWSYCDRIGLWQIEEYRNDYILATGCYRIVESLLYFDRLHRGYTINESDRMVVKSNCQVKIVQRPEWAEPLASDEYVMVTWQDAAGQAWYGVTHKDILHE